ncbi:predicted protein [Sclerotinia sclerotiorum 1980 UF-70]|uniref:Uncharacterized protein n=1 Tax=Sclerotinia sclerotiorum (strain ATCC 18683 / 1980 / Ss-1) TaxID=665079 RepID=A7EMY7_SCLS1|nr:predicted protein [Sclerotinia sclerotiorum 1980 UF-70]EDO04203.1 predicted protein [Sclerotinia sclerotiorum 1980 UF-70]
MAMTIISHLCGITLTPNRGSDFKRYHLEVLTMPV